MSIERHRSYITLKCPFCILNQTAATNTVPPCDCGNLLCSYCSVVGELLVFTELTCMLYERQESLTPVVDVGQVDPGACLRIILAGDENEHEERLDDAGRYI